MDSELNLRIIQIRTEMMRIKAAMEDLNGIVKYQNLSNNPLFSEKATQSYQMHNSIVETISKTLLLIETIKAQVVDVNLSQWRRQQQEHRLGIGPKTDTLELHRIQSSYEELSQNLLDVKTVVVKLADIHRYINFVKCSRL